MASKPQTSALHLVHGRIEQIITLLSPSKHEEELRQQVFAHVERTVFSIFGSKAGLATIPVGSWPTKTYLPDGDVDISIISCSPIPNWREQLCKALTASKKFPISSFQYIDGRVSTFKCVVKDVSFDFVLNAPAGVFSNSFFSRCNARIENQLLRRSIILTKAFLRFELHAHGSGIRLLSTYSISVLVLWAILSPPSVPTTPLAVLARVLSVLATFPWTKGAIAFNGPSASVGGALLPLAASHSLSRTEGLSVRSGHMRTSSDSGIIRCGRASHQFIVQLFSRKLETAFREAREYFYATTGDVDGTPRSFMPFNINILDPLNPVNNLGNPVSAHNLEYIQFKADEAQVLLRALLRVASRTPSDPPGGAKILAITDMLLRNTWEFLAEKRAHKVTGLSQTFLGNDLSAVSLQNFYKAINGLVVQPATPPPPRQSRHCRSLSYGTPRTASRPHAHSKRVETSLLKAEGDLPKHDRSNSFSFS